MGAATALYSATCHTLGKYGNGNLYPINLSAVIGLSGWLPCSRFESVHTDMHIETHVHLIYVKLLLWLFAFIQLNSAL